MLAREVAPAQAVRRVERLVLGEVDRMSRLVDDLLFLARTDEARFLTRETIDLERLIADLFELSAGTTPRRFEVEPVPPAGWTPTRRD